MSQSKIIPIVLTGGSGTRLWPLSRASKPKQFLSFGGEHSLFQETLLRCQNDEFDPSPIIVGSSDHRFLLAEDMRNLDVKGDIILEPVGRDSCAAIAVGCLAALNRDPDALVMVLAADHAIKDRNAFVKAAKLAAECAQDNYLITFGIKPTKPATGYGYIKCGEPIENSDVFKVEKFCEKPDAATATEFMADGYLWNSGNFLFRAAAFLRELKNLAPEIQDAAHLALKDATTDLDFLHLSKVAFEKSPSISIDYAVMEKTKRSAVFPVEYDWSDLGTWQSIQEHKEGDANANTVFGDAVLIDCKQSLIHSESSLTAIVGVDNLIVVNTSDALMICSKDKSEDIKGLVDLLKSQGRKQAVEALIGFRPWGNYEQLDINNGYQVKRIVVNPGGVLSLQRHKFRAEHWIVVEGEAEVTIDGSVTTLLPNQSTYIPLGSVHRLANTTDEPLTLIEVQTGTYFGEDDIERLEDYYNRPNTE